MINGAVRASVAERSKRLPGDDLIPSPIGTLTHAITINAPASNLWPWLVQMGAGRAGWYSYDRFDNGGRRSAERILPDYQHLTIGTVMPALPGVREGFLVLAFEPSRYLILGWGSPPGAPLVTWAFVLEPITAERTRLIVRARAGRGYRLFGLPPALTRHLAGPVHWLMQRKQLLGLKRRIERTVGLAA